MAGAKTAVHQVQLKPIEVDESLTKGNKFIKWEDDSTVGIPVTLKVDPKGYILYWKDQYKEMDCLEISLIRDTRTGKYARTPKDRKLENFLKEGKLKDSCTMGSGNALLEDKTISICHGTDMVNLQWTNFTCNSKEVAKLWTDEILKYAYNLLSANASFMSFLDKIHTKLSLIVSHDGLIPIRNIHKQFAQQKDTRKKVVKALQAAGLPSDKNEMIPPKKFQMKDFLAFVRHVTARSDVDKIFDEIGAKKKPYLTTGQFIKFLNTVQRDPRLNEIIYPFYDEKKASDIINRYETNQSMAKRGQLSQECFLLYLMSDENQLIPLEILDLNHDMNQPLAHYFINSSHNTYLTGHQFTGRSSVEIYRQVLLSGCRCIELDCWDGRNNDEEPMITHGYTMCTEVPFKDVLEAIAESAFKTSDLPVILSFENHCTVRQQAKMAQHCRNIFGDMLLTEPLEKYPVRHSAPLPSPNNLKRKILVKNKKQHGHKGAPPSPNPLFLPTGVSEVEDKPPLIQSSPVHLVTTPPVCPINENLLDICPDMPNRPDSPESDFGSESDSDESDSETPELSTDQGTAGKEASAGAEMSALVNYITPVHFHSFEISDKKNRSFEISSFVETQALQLLKDYPVEFVNYNKRQMSRIYPRGTRVDSSNYLPQVYWNAGSQLVALNFQTLDLAMQINLGTFEYNSRCGYLLKPLFMRQSDKDFDPFAESTVDGIVAGTLSIQIISGQFLSDKSNSLYVEVDMFGLPADTVRRKYRTKTASGISAQFDDKPFIFKKIVAPSLASLRIAVIDDQGRLLGHRILPFDGLRPGYRHLHLNNTSNQPLSLATLFIKTEFKDYVPEGLSNFADALANPIQFQMDQEVLAQKHLEQLAVLTEEFEEEGVTTTPNQTNSHSIVEVTPSQSSVYSKTSSILRHSDSDNSMQSGTESNRNSGYGSQRPSVKSQVVKQESTGSQGSGVLAASPSPACPHGFMSKTMSAQNLEGAQSIVVTTRLNDPTVTEVITVDKLKQTKTFQKLYQKLTKETDTIHRKLDRARMNLEEENEIKVDRLTVRHLKARSNQDKTHKKLLKKAEKTPGAINEVTQKHKDEVDHLVQRQLLQVWELKKMHMKTVIDLCCDFHKIELDTYLHHHGPTYSTLKQMVADEEENQISYLQEICEQEATELKKKLETQSRQGMKALAKDHKNKQELSRLKRESQQKHIAYCVSEIKKLKDILEKKTDDVKEGYKQLHNNLEAEKKEAKLLREEVYENNNAATENELLQAFQKQFPEFESSNKTDLVTGSQAIFGEELGHDAPQTDIGDNPSDGTTSNNNTNGIVKDGKINGILPTDNSQGNTEEKYVTKIAISAENGTDTMPDENEAPSGDHVTSHMTTGDNLTTGDHVTIITVNVEDENTPL